MGESIFHRNVSGLGMDNNETKRLNGLIKHFEKGRFAELIPLCEEFVKNHPANAIGWNLLALSHKNLGNIEKARTLFEKLLQNDPNHPVLLSNLGNVYRSIGRLQDSVTCYKKAIKKDPNMFNAIEALGMSYTDLGDLEKALSCYKRNTELDKTHQLARYNVANTYRKLKRYEEAVEEFELTDYKNGESHQLECLYLLGDEKRFKEKYLKIENSGKLDSLIGCLGSHAAIRYQTPFKNPFCSNAMDYVLVDKITAEDGLTQELMDKIIEHHKGNLNDYLSQPLLKNGKQSSGNLFLLEYDFIKALEQILIVKVEAYRQKFQTNDEGFIKNWPDKYFLYGWLVSIENGGNLDPHIHKEGWVSGSLYFNVPKKDGSDDGNIAVSLHGANYPKDNKDYPGKVVEINKRDLCMFPSSLFHYTIPFESEEERISFAFDVMPTQ